MKVFLLIASISVFFRSFGECAPPNADEARPLKKKVTFNANPEIIDDRVPNPGENLIFNMNINEFEKNVSKKFELFTASETEALFLVNLAVVIQSNFLMYNKVYGYVNGLDRYDTDMCQIGMFNESGHQIKYPDAEIFDKLVGQKESLKQKLILLLNAMQSSYDMVEHLIEMMNSMDADTKVDQQMYMQMYRESASVVEVSAEFDVVFKKFPLEEYRKVLNKIRKTTKYLQAGKRNATEAEQILTESVPALDEIWWKLEKKANKGLQLNCTKLFDATTNVRAFVMQLLNFDEASFSNYDTASVILHEAYSTDCDTQCLNFQEAWSLNSDTRLLNFYEAWPSSECDTPLLLNSKETSAPTCNTKGKGKILKRLKNFFKKLSIKK